MARMKFLCDAERCIECNGCVTACKNENEVPWGVNRRRVVTVNDGVVGAEKSMSVACMHCSDAPCMAVCPVDCFYHTEDGLVLHDKDLCIGCGYCFYACPFGAPQFPPALHHKDPYFGEVHTYRDHVAIRLPVKSRPAAAQTLDLVVTSQGCADLGVCYTPMDSTATIRLAALGAAPPSAGPSSRTRPSSSRTTRESGCHSRALPPALFRPWHRRT